MKRILSIFFLTAAVAYAQPFAVPQGRTYQDVFRYCSDAGRADEIGKRVVYLPWEQLFDWRPPGLAFPTAAQCDYSASPTNSVVWYSNHVAEIKGQMQDADPMLKAAILGLMDAFNSKLPATNRVTVNQLKNAIKGRLE